MESSETEIIVTCGRCRFAAQEKFRADGFGVIEFFVGAQEKYHRTNARKNQPQEY